MKILFVRPKPSKETIGLQHLMIVEPLELEILSALKRPTDQSFLADLIIDKKPLEHYIRNIQPDVICITGYITNVNSMIAYCKTAKQICPSIATVVGGVHCEVCPDDLNDPAIDFRVVRNAGVLFTDLLNHIAEKTPLPAGVLTYNMEFVEENMPAFDFRIPFPDRALTKKHRDKYFYIFHKKVALIKTSFGCPYKCNFCFCRVITRDKYFQRPMDEVIQELLMIEETEVYIVDDDFLSDRKRIALFISELRKHSINKHYLVYGRADFIAANPDLMKEMYDLGLRTVIVGFESFSEEELNKYHKNTKVQENKEAMRVLNEIGIDCFATIILSPDWDVSDFTQMVKWLKELDIRFVNLQPLTPLPKTGVEFPGELILIEKQEYEKWDLAHISVRPSKMSVADYYNAILKAYFSILFQRPVLFSYFRRYSFPMMWKMLTGSQKVTRQYKNKIKEARLHA